MVLRELKREVERLQDVGRHVEQFQEHWVKPLNKTNGHLPFLQNLSPATKKELQEKLIRFHHQLNGLRGNQAITDKLQQYTRYLIEMKLTTLNGDRNKSSMITKRMLSDDVLNIRQTIEEVQQFEDSMKGLAEQYEEINELLQKSLSLEEMLFYLELPHRKYLVGLQKTAEKQKKIVRDIGHHFVKLAKETSLHKAPHK